MCIQAIASCVSSALGIRHEPIMPLDKCNDLEMRVYASALKSLGDEPVWVRNKLKLDISDRENCVIEWEIDSEARHQHRASSQLQVPPLPNSLLGSYEDQKASGPSMAS